MKMKESDIGITKKPIKKPKPKDIIPAYEELHRAVNAIHNKLLEEEPLSLDEMRSINKAMDEIWNIRLKAAFPNGIKTQQRFIVCDICGNKRCPHATDHNLKCTGSNALGQRGSIHE